MSVGKLPASVTTFRPAPPRRSSDAASLNRLTDVESETATSPADAPISGAMASPARRARKNQSASSQLRISPSPHSSSTVPRMDAAVVRGRAPSELPSR